MRTLKGELWAKFTHGSWRGARRLASLSAEESHGHSQQLPHSSQSLQTVQQPLMRRDYESQGTRHYLWIVSTSLFAALTTPTGSVQAQEALEAFAARYDTRITVTDYAIRHEIAVSTFLGVGTYWIAPVFVLGSVEIDGYPLFSDGTLSLPAIDADSGLNLDISLIDLLKKPGMQEQVRSMLREDSTLQGKDMFLLPRSNKGNAVLILHSASEEKQLARANFWRADNKEEILLRLQLVGNTVRTLREASASELELRIDIPYECEFSSKDYEIGVDAAISHFVKLLSSVKTRGSGDSIIFVPIGGAGAESSNAYSSLSNILSVKVKSYNDSIPVPVELVNSIATVALSSWFTETAKEGILADQEIVLILQDGITLQGSMGKLSAASSSHLKMSKDASDDLYNKLVASSEFHEWSGGLSFGKLNFGAGSSQGKDSLDSLETRKARFRESLDSAARMFSGDVVALPTLTLTQARQLSTNKKNSARVVQQSNVRTGTMHFQISFGFDATKKNSLKSSERDWESAGKEIFDAILDYATDVKQYGTFSCSYYIANYYGDLPIKEMARPLLKPIWNSGQKDGAGAPLDIFGNRIMRPEYVNERIVGAHGVELPGPDPVAYWNTKGYRSEYDNMDAHWRPVGLYRPVMNLRQDPSGLPKAHDFTLEAPGPYPISADLISAELNQVVEMDDAYRVFPGVWGRMFTWRCLSVGELKSEGYRILELDVDSMGFPQPAYGDRTPAIVPQQSDLVSFSLVTRTDRLSWTSDLVSAYEALPGYSEPGTVPDRCFGSTCSLRSLAPLPGNLFTRDDRLSLAGKPGLLREHVPHIINAITYRNGLSSCAECPTGVLYCAGFAPNARTVDASGRKRLGRMWFWLWFDRAGKIAYIDLFAE